ISREACLQQRLHLLSEIPADLGLCDTKNRDRLAAVSLLPHALDSTGQAGLPPVLNTCDRESAPKVANADIWRKWGADRGRRTACWCGGRQLNADDLAAQTGQPARLRVDAQAAGLDRHRAAAADAEIEVQPVLHRFALWHHLEPDPWP